MGEAMMRQQALSTPGSVLGTGGYVYRPADDGRSVTILHDPTGQATGSTLSAGDHYEAIKYELQQRGAMPAAAPSVPASGTEFVPDAQAEQMRQQAIMSEQEKLESAPSAQSVSDEEAEQMRQQAIMAEQEKVESPRDALERLQLLEQAERQAEMESDTAEPEGRGRQRRVFDRENLKRKLAAGELDMTNAPGGDINPWRQAAEALAARGEKPDTGESPSQYSPEYTGPIVDVPGTPPKTAPEVVEDVEDELAPGGESVSQDVLIPGLRMAEAREDIKRRRRAGEDVDNDDTGFAESNELEPLEQRIKRIERALKLIQGEGE
jgi:hypothetical protein